MGNSCSTEPVQKEKEVEFLDEARLTSGHDVLVCQPPEAKILVTVVGARGFREGSWLPGTGKPDCFVVVRSGLSQVHKTGTIKDALEPMWRETFGVRSWVDGDPLEFHLFAANAASEEDFLGKATLESSAFAAGYNAEAKIVKDEGSEMQAVLRLKIQMAGQELPEPPGTGLEITCQKGLNACWGLDLNVQDPAVLCINKVGTPGAINEYNDSATQEEKVQSRDFIFDLNGIEGDSQAMLNQFQEKNEVVMKVVHGLETSIIFDRQENLPLGVEFFEKSVSKDLIIRKIDDGAAKAHNDAVPEVLRLQVSDRITAVAGTSGFSSDVRNLLEKATGKVQLTIWRPYCSAMKSHWEL